MSTAPAMETPAMTAITLEDATALIWREADMLDRLDYKAWLPLWTAAGLYIIPTDPGAEDYREVLNIAYDNAEMREMRTRRLMSGFSMSSAPPARTVRTVSRFVVTASEANALEVRAGMVLVEYKYDHTRVMAADVEYRVVREGDALKLDRKVVKLVNADDYLHGLGYLL